MFRFITFCLKLLPIVVLTGVKGVTGLQAQEAANRPSSDPDLMEYVSRMHGPDQELINGIQFYNSHFRVTGHPYLMGAQSFPGSVYLSGKKYGGLQLHYDIYDQHLVLDYRTTVGGMNKIILSPMRIEDFTINGFDFRKLNLDEKGLRYYQVIQAGELTCYVHWRKGLIPNNMNLQSLGSFTFPYRTFYLEQGDRIQSFASRKSFAALFPPKVRGDIKRYMRNNEIRFRRAEPGELTTLIRHVSSLQPVTNTDE